MAEEQALSPPGGTETVLSGTTVVAGVSNAQVGEGKTDESVAAEAKAAEEKAAEDKGTEGQTDEEKAAAEKAAAEAAEHAPEAYEEFKVPEGTEVDAGVLEEFQTLAKEFDLSQEKAQKLIDLQASFIEKVHAGIEERNLKVWEKMRGDWLVDAKKDKGIGGQEFAANVDLAKRALSQFGTPELVELFETFGFGNHPEIIRFTSRVGAALGEDTIKSGGNSNVAKSLADRIYTSP